MGEMKAVLFDRYGPPEVLYVGRRPVPGIGPDEVLVRVRAAGVNGGDLHDRAGKVRLVTGRAFPKGCGIDFAGEVAEVGASVRGVREGERVWGLLGRRTGSMAEYVAVSPRRIAPAPGNLTPEEAVSLLAGATTAVTALRDKAALQPGERLLVRGGSGGVGSVAVQVGKVLGARVVALAGGRNLDFVRGLGAEEALDHRTTALSALGRFDVVLDTVGTEQARVRRLLAPGGRMVAVAPDLDRPLGWLGTVLGSVVHGKGRIRFFSGNPDGALLAEAARLAERGDIVPVVDTVHPLDGVADAQRALAVGGVRGKHVVRVA
ncbi:NAD(P)-dependent alcohol dehydrogenase [Streptomyces coelicoflavus]|uniref:NAD(P)-dependent alcohol dehydrogenase n=1 Tax=Streptomyces coelicoflavus TaxID=285562 RepID=A0A7K3PE83_9ACTN|nr:NAD(P)-dependent alcohol dehydrogenase [Streptomyces coelicoflavus]NEB08207.1 NAD(P)-dependent alcohol dehydrogenase [Streptomyces coelicoflavus]